MQINRDNYETFFLLYIDNELTPGERRLIEDFVQENPDLRQELDFLTDTILVPDTKVSFKNPGILHHASDTTSINALNREEYFLLYADGELDETNKKAVEAYIFNQPVYQKELQEIVEARVEPNLSEVYTNKESLYRREKTQRPFIMRWIGISAAACMLLIAGATWWFHNPNRNQLGDIGKIPLVKIPRSPATPAPALLPVTGKRKLDSFLAAKPDPIIANKAIKATINVPVIAINQKSKTPVKTGELAKHEAPADRTIIKSTLPKNMVPQELAIVPEITADSPAEKATGLVHTAKPPVVDEEVVLSDPFEERNNTTVVLTNISDENKNVFRGLFRKTARFIDRNTSLKASKRPGIHIGNFEIAFQ